MADQVHLRAVAQVIARVAARVADLRKGDAGTRVPPLPELPADTRLRALGERAGLSAPQLDALVLVAAADAHPLALADLSRLTSDPARPGVEAGAVAAVAEYGGRDADAVLAALGPASPLLTRGLCEPIRGDAPMPARRVTLAARVHDYLRGPVTGAPPDLPSDVEPVRTVDEVVAGAGVAELGRHLLPQVLDGRTLWVTGPRGVGKRTLLAALAAAAGRRLLVVDYRTALGRPAAELCAILWREVLVADALPLISSVEPASGDPQRAIPLLHEALVRARLPAVMASPSQPMLGDFDSPPLTLDMTNPDALRRGALWVKLLPEVERIGEVAPQYRLPPGRIVRVAAAARGAAAAGSRPCDLGDVTRAVSAEIAQKITILGDRVIGTQTWDDLVLPQQTVDAMHEIVDRAKWRHRVLQEWGFERKLAKGLGVSALFAGPPGTGKTMCASIIARDLALELYQVDLSRVVSKYVGETEKNLSEVFEAADWGNVLLLFDEADALFSKRTEVKSSNDRFSNMEVNYLLTRLEKFEGVAILTTNLEGALDPAFKRRLTFRVSFAMPDVAERELLWRRMVPVEARVDETLDFAALANAYELTGGNIRNAMLRAAFLAAGELSGITMDSIRRAVELEYRDAGKLSVGGKLHE